MRFVDLSSFDLFRSTSFLLLEAAPLFCDFFLASVDLCKTVELALFACRLQLLHLLRLGFPLSFERSSIAARSTPPNEQHGPHKQRQWELVARSGQEAFEFFHSASCPSGPSPRLFRKYSFVRRISMPEHTFAPKGVREVSSIRSPVSQAGLGLDGQAPIVERPIFRHNLGRCWSEASAEGADVARERCDPWSDARPSLWTVRLFKRSHPLA